MNRTTLAIAICVVGLVVLPASAVASVIDPGSRSVSAGPFQVQWNTTNPEEIMSLSWKGSPNLTNSWFLRCTGDLEYFGDSWGT
jgi:hypothetical protein